MKFFSFAGESEQQEIMKSLGYTPVPLETADILPAIQTGMIKQRLAGFIDRVVALAFAANGKLLATGSYDQKIKLWDSATGAEVRTLTGHNGAVYGLAFRPEILKDHRVGGSRMKAG